MVEPMTIVHPAAGEKWVVGTTQTITWTSNGTCGNDLLIHLFKGGVWKSTIGWTTDDGTHMWAISSTLIPASDYSIEIEKNGNSLCSNYDTWSRKFELISATDTCTVPICNLIVA